MEHLSRIESGCFNTHSLAGVIHQIVISDDYNSFNTHSLAGVILYHAIRSLIVAFQYALPCGSDSKPREYKLKLCFNTHSLAGVILQKVVKPLNRVSIRTPLREWFTATTRAHLSTFQYALPCGSDSGEIQKPRRSAFQYALPCGSDSIICVCPARLCFNTHSLAGVIQRHLPNLRSKNPVNFVRLLNALRLL